MKGAKSATTLRPRVRSGVRPWEWIAGPGKGNRDRVLLGASVSGKTVDSPPRAKPSRQEYRSYISSTSLLFERRPTDSMTHRLGKVIILGDLPSSRYGDINPKTVWTGIDSKTHHLSFWAYATFLFLHLYTSQKYILRPRFSVQESWWSLFLHSHKRRKDSLLDHNVISSSYFTY